MFQLEKSQHRENGAVLDKLAWFNWNMLGGEAVGFSPR